ncbi:hypothetical protein FACS1894163_07120 [Spirochaetia bacterium]|nr:hypothetical protein FACS1894163_07120 [Spirochaetia bacterium]
MKKNSFVFGLLAIGAFIALITACDQTTGSKSGGKAITAFVIGLKQAEINDPVITIALPQGTDVTNLAPRITVSEKASVSPASGVARDFSESSVIYTVTAEDGTTKDYIVIVTIGGDEPNDTRTLLVAGPNVPVDYTATTATATFTGAAGLTGLTPADFAVTGSAALGSPTVNGNTVTIEVYFAANIDISAKTYVVGIAPTSTKIKGSSTVTITQAFNDPSDTRTLLVAGPAVDVAGSDSSVNVTFIGATTLPDLYRWDFEIDNDASIQSLTINGNTVTVEVYIGRNTGADKIYTVRIAPTSTKIRGVSTVTITQHDIRTLLVAGPAVSVYGSDSSVKVTFTGATGAAGLYVSTGDFSVDNGAMISNVIVNGDIITVDVYLGENTGASAKTYIVSIASGSNVIRGSSTVTITHAEFIRTLLAGPAVDVADSDTYAVVTFTGAVRLIGLTDEDFAVTGGASLYPQSAYLEDTVTVGVWFGENSSASEKTYVVSIAPDSAKIKGSATVTITQAGLTRVLLSSWGSSEDVSYSETTAYARFHGDITEPYQRTVLNGLTTADFAVSGGATLGNLTFSDDYRNYYVSMPVNFAANTSASAKTYVVSIAPDSTRIQGSATVTITQDAIPLLVAGPDIYVYYTATTATATFTGAADLTGLTAADFAVTGGAALGSPTVNDDTVTIPVNFGANTGASAKTYVVSIAPGNTKIRGSSTVTITQDFEFVWTAVSGSTFGTTATRGITYGGGKFVAYGEAGQMAYSTDGITWTAVSNSTFGSGTTIHDITYGGGKFVALGGYDQMAYSPDGITWTAVSNSTFTTDRYGSTVSIYGIAYGGDKFVAVGSFGQMAYSTNGITWTAVSDSPFGSLPYVTFPIYGIAYGGGKFVAISRQGLMAYSTDGITWTAVSNSTFGSGTTIHDITYGGGKFVAVGGNGKMAYSTDGITWTAVPYPNTFSNSSPINGIAYGGGKFVAVGNIDQMAYSRDGITWTAVSNSIFDNFTSIGRIAYGGGRFFAVGDTGTIAYSNAME